MAFIPPIKIVFSGDIPSCYAYKKFAANQLAILEKLMSFQGLNEGRRIISPYPGVEIECISRFGKKETRIHVDPITYKFVTEQQVIEEKEKKEEIFGRDYLYYVRIECIEEPPGIKTDRVILYEMKFEGTPEGQPLTPDGKPLYNSNKNFSPGQGTVIADVDLLNRILIYPEVVSEENPDGISVEEADALLLKVRRLSSKMASVIDPYNGLNNNFLDWYAVGPLTNISTSADLGGYDAYMPDERITGLFLNSPYTTGDVSWYFPTAPLSFYEDFDNPLSTWRSIWSPMYGGDTRFYMDFYPWDDFDDAVLYYGTFTVPTVNPQIYEIYDSYTQEVFPFIYMRWGLEGVNITFDIDTELDPCELIDGMFCTPAPVDPPGSPINAPSFFIVEMGIPVLDSYKSVITVGDGNNMNTWDIGAFDPTQIYVYVNHPTTMSLITPLEIIDVREYRTAPDTSASCSEMEGLYWDLLSSGGGVALMPEDSIQYSSYPQDYLGKLSALKWFGQSEENLSYRGPDGKRGYWYYKNEFSLPDATNENNLPETTKLYSIFILDEPEQKDPKYQTKFGSLFYLDELVAAGVSAVNMSSWGGPAINDYFCDGQRYWNLDDSKRTFTRTLGCVVYIFAPPEVYSEDDNGIKTYWDIHSGRVDEDVINPYRCFDLEEYLITVFQGIEKDLDASTWTTKMITEPPLAKGLSWFGYSVKTGFVI